MKVNKNKLKKHHIELIYFIHVEINQSDHIFTFLTLKVLTKINTKIKFLNLILPVNKIKLKPFFVNSSLFSTENARD